MADEDPQTFTIRRSTVVRIGITVAILAALGIGLAIGLSVRSPDTTPAASTKHHPYVKETIAPSTTTTAAPTTTTTTAPPTTTTTANAARAALAPATTPPVSNECSIPISYSADGSPYPSTCPSGGGVNTVAWAQMANTYPTVLALGANATQAQVLQTLCNLPNVVGGEVSITVTMAAEYYGWPFASVVEGWYPGDPTYCG